jgi:[FeFe] hydrogenase H-cluster maturation GTPase HydF
MRGPSRGFRLNIGIFGRRNVGKSSILNAITEQNTSIVSPEAGTTTDPVEKPMELLPLGPVLFIDTAGVDDAGELGELRIKKTEKIFDRVDVAVLVAEGNAWGEFEERIIREFLKRETPLIVAFNKGDLYEPASEVISRLESRNLKHVTVLATRGRDGVLPLIEAIKKMEDDLSGGEKKIIADLVGKGETAVLVIPIDKEAPKGRIILPQVQVLRELLDIGAISVVATDKELASALSGLSRPPKIVVTDSQAFKEVDEIVPKDIALTSFSILFSRFYGDLREQAKGASTIGKLKDGDKILIAEGCTHHPIGDDIGRVKIPHWLQEKLKIKLHFNTVQGRDFPDDPSPFAMVIHCGNCMGNRSETLNRIKLCREKGVPVTNYGISIACIHGILERALSPFPSALEAYRSAVNE